MGPVCKNVKLSRWLFIDYRALQFTRLGKCRNSEGCWHFRSAPTPCLHCQPNEKILVLFFLSLEKVHSPLHLGSSFPEASMCGLCKNTRSPALMCFFFTFLYLHTLALVGLYVASALVLALQSLVSSGVTDSSSYSNLKGVNFVALQMEVL
jgi:hypothetical protein